MKISAKNTDKKNTVAISDKMVIPGVVRDVVFGLNKNGFEAYIVGGCVRDFLLAQKSGRAIVPQDWDVATSAKPEQISKTFPKSFSDNKFGTVTVLTGSENPTLKEIEITTYRIDENYSDKRHPDSVSYAKTIKEDLARRDFTINAIALGLKEEKEVQSFEIIDPFEGQKDLEGKLVRAVGKADDRFQEDALRLMRAVRFATVLGFEIEQETAKAVQKNSSSLKAISGERIRDEFMKIIMAENASEGIDLLLKLGLLKYVLPELEEGCGVSQNKHHIYGCYDHALKSLQYAAKKNYNKFVRIAALLHDIAKPRVKRGQGQEATFYGHEVVGARMADKALNRLKFPKKEIEKIVTLVRYHLFYYNVDEVSDSSIRRLVRQVGPESMEELLQLRTCDRIGSGVPKAEPYKLRHLKYVIERVSLDPISVKMLKVNGNDVIKILGIKPGPKIGQILDFLLGYVLNDPAKNTKEILEKEVKKLGELNEKQLQEMADRAKKEREKVETKRDEMTKKKYWVT